MTKKIITVEGMHCMHCAKRVNDAVSALAGASKVSVDLEKGTVSLMASPEFSAEKAAAAIKALGFEVLS